MSMAKDLADVVHHAAHKEGLSPGHDDEQSTEEGDDRELAPLKAHDSPSQQHAHYKGQPTTPSMRTGPPRTISYVYSLPSTPNASRANSRHENENGDMNNIHDGFPFTKPESDFRGALEVSTPSIDTSRKGKKKEKDTPRESWFGAVEESWNPLNPLKWFQESPKDEKTGFEFPTKTTDTGEGPSSAATEDRPNLPGTSLRRGQSTHSEPTDTRKAPRARWGRLKSLIPNVVHNNQNQNALDHAAVIPQAVNITDELIAGGLSTLMLRLWFERDDKDQRRIPILFHRLRIRVSDSLHPTHGTKAVFRIECEYANGASKWVVYRQLRDFISLHTHYRASNAYNRDVDDLPDFPKTSLPYLKFLKNQSKEKGEGAVKHSDFARMQREALENYLLDLIRAVMFHPATNRLAKFLEISALSISLAPSGGWQAKAGYLYIEAIEHKGWGRKNAGWKAKREARWCAIRESYLVALVEPGELAVWDVFLLDSDFKIERPKRYYRQGLKLLHAGDSDDSNMQEEKRETQSDRHKGGLTRLTGSLPWRKSKSHNQLQHGANGDAHSIASSSSSSSSSSDGSGHDMMLDPSTNANPLHGPDEPGDRWHPDIKKKRKDVSKHTFFISNSQIRLKLFARNQRQMLQWITALEKAAATSHYTGGNRFDSFAPIRLNVAAQWLVDGRDYFWNLSRAMLLAKEVIYIHDWWVSPELQMRRPGQDRYRLDRLLERKAKEGVKIYIILYQEVSNRTTPTDSNYTKQRLTSLHPNIMVQRSPSHFQTGTFYWAHHEKMCVIDQAIVFMGGLDLCFGRWDTPQHVLNDDTEGDPDRSEIWPGKDYNNPRVQDFHTLNKPEEDLYDRSKVPRMPWHDVAMQVVGQPARDLARHFVQRWNYLLRIKNHSRVMPFLLPPPEFRPGELTELGLTGTCEMQIVRSAGPWSIGTPTRVEHSIQNAYLKAIQMSEHFVYIENQFFITSTVVNETKIENKIGDALVHRIIRAHRDGTPWKCCINIPLLPGFTFPIDHSDASAVRIILECQNRTIGRGPDSIYSRLRKEGINPDDYICVFSLRNWTKLRGVLTTEQVYIHGKVCIVDDRLAIIGSANINERSQRGDRDSEIAAVIRDTDMIDGTMAGKPFKVGRFAHTLRVRLMREHLGVDVDSLYEEDLMANDPEKSEMQQDVWDPDAEQRFGQENGTTVKAAHTTAIGGLLKTTGNGIAETTHGAAEAASHVIEKNLAKAGLNQGPKASVGDKNMDEERQTYTREGEQVPGFASSMVPTMEEKIVALENPVDKPATSEAEELEEGQKNTGFTTDGEKFGAPADASKSPQTDDEPPHARSGIDDSNEEEKAAPAARNLIRKTVGNTIKHQKGEWTLPTPRPKVDANKFSDPIIESFWRDTWMASAVHNTEIYRKVFHAVPDDLVTTWKQYREFVAHHDRMNKPVKDSDVPPVVGRVPSETGEAAPSDAVPQGGEYLEARETEVRTSREGGEKPEELNAKGATRKSARGDEAFEKWELDEMEKLLGELNGHLVLYPTRFLEGEDVANNFLFNADRLLPLPIYD